MRTPSGVKYFIVQIQSDAYFQQVPMYLEVFALLLIENLSV